MLQGPVAPYCRIKRPIPHPDGLFIAALWLYYTSFEIHLASCIALRTLVRVIWLDSTVHRTKCVTNWVNKSCWLPKCTPVTPAKTAFAFSPVAASSCGAMLQWNTSRALQIVPLLRGGFLVCLKTRALISSITERLWVCPQQRRWLRKHNHSGQKTRKLTFRSWKNTPSLTAYMSYKVTTFLKFWISFPWHAHASSLGVGGLVSANIGMQIQRSDPFPISERRQEPTWKSETDQQKSCHNWSDLHILFLDQKSIFLTREKKVDRANSFNDMPTDTQ